MLIGTQQSEKCAIARHGSAANGRTTPTRPALLVMQSDGYRKAVYWILVTQIWSMGR